MLSFRFFYARLLVLKEGRTWIWEEHIHVVSIAS